MAKLIFLGEKFAGRVYEFTVPKTTVGRSDHNTLTIQDASVSHAHCEIYAYGPDVIVRDLGSSNGTRVNGELLHNQQRPLAAGQIVQFGNIAARLDVGQIDDTDDTDVTAVHSYARFVHEQKLASKNNPPPSVILGNDSGVTSADQTILLTRSPETGNVPPALIEPVVAPAKRSNKIAIIASIGLAVVAALVFVWLLWGRR